MCHWHSCAFFVGISCVFVGSFLFFSAFISCCRCRRRSFIRYPVYWGNAAIKEMRSTDGVPMALRQRKEDFLDHQNKNKIIFIWLHVIQKRYVYDSGLQFTIDADVCRKSWNVFDVVILCIRTCAVCEVGMSSLIFCFVLHLLHPEDFPHFFPLKFYRFNFIIHWLGLSSALLCDVRKKIEEKIQPHNLLTSQIEWSIKLLNWHRDWKHLLDQALQWKSHKQTDKDFSLVNNAI